MISEIRQKDDLLTQGYTSTVSTKASAGEDNLFSGKAGSVNIDNLFNGENDESYLNVNSSDMNDLGEEISEEDDVDEGGAKSMLSNGKNQKTKAQSNGQVCVTKAEQSEKDAEIAQQNAEDALARMEDVQSSIQALSADHISMQTGEQATANEIQQQQEQLQVIEEQIKMLEAEAQMLQGSDNPEDIEKLAAISTQINALAQVATQSQESLKGKQAQLQEQVKGLKDNSAKQVDFFGQMNDLGVEFEEENNSMSEFAEKLKDFSEKVKEFGDKVEHIGQAMIGVGNSLIASGTASSIFSCGATSGLITLGEQLVSTGEPVEEVGQTVSTVGSVGLGIADATLAITDPAGINIGNFISAARGAISAGEGISGAASAAESDVNNMLGTITTFDEKVKEFTDIDERVAQMINGLSSGNIGDAFGSVKELAQGGIPDMQNMFGQLIAA